jgi:hypothetical protein
MHLKIDGIFATCFSCSSDDFALLRPNPGSQHDLLACARCCNEVSYEDLLIGRTAMAQKKAEDLLAQIRRIAMRKTKSD